MNSQRAPSGALFPLFSSVPRRFQAVLLMGRAGLSGCRGNAGFGLVCLKGFFVGFEGRC